MSVKEYVVHNVRHCQQKENWDCGVASVMMVLPERDFQHFQLNFAAVCHEEGFGKSTWTIDLAYILRRFNVKHNYCTITLGVDPGYQNEGYYDRILGKDQERVNRRFESASSDGVVVNKMSLDISSIISHLNSNDGLAVVVLVNAELLCCDICHSNKLAAELRACLPWSSTSYQGHYIVLIGYDLKYNKVIYRNPSVNDRVCVTTFAMFDRARKSYGTDEDIVLVWGDSGSRGCGSGGANRGNNNNDHQTNASTEIQRSSEH